MSVIFASSTCDLDLKTLKKVDVDVINLPTILNGKKCLYNADKFNFDEYYANNTFSVDFDSYKQLIHKKYLEALSSGQDILFLTPNAKYDASYAIVNQEIKQYIGKYPDQKIEMVDCQNCGLGYGLIVYEAGIANMHGSSITEVMSFVNTIKRNIKTYIIPSTNENIKEQLTIVGSSIGVRPVLELVGGELKVVDNVKGKKKAVDYLYEKAKSNSNEVPLGIMCGKNTDEATTIADLINKVEDDRVILKSNLNPMLLKKFGDKTLAVSYYKKSKS